MSAIHPDLGAGGRTVCSRRVGSKWENEYDIRYRGRGKAVTSLSPGVCGGPVIPGVHV